MSLIHRLTQLHIDLPPNGSAGALYTPVVRHASTAYVSGQLPRDGDRIFVTGKVGRDVDLAAAKQGARLAFVRALAALRDSLDSLDDVERVLKLTVFVQSADAFSGQSAVADGASELIFDLFGAKEGKHARTCVGVTQLPRNASVEVDVVVALSK